METKLECPFHHALVEFYAMARPSLGVIHLLKKMITEGEQWQKVKSSQLDTGLSSNGEARASSFDLVSSYGPSTSF